MKTSSVGMFATYGIPAAVTDSTPCQRDSGQQPDREIGARAR